MGGIHSRLQPAVGPVDYFAVTLREPDKLIVIAAPPDVLEQIVKPILLRYPISNHGPNDTDGYTFKTSGRPFSSQQGMFSDNKADAAQMRWVFCDLFAALSAAGWEVAATSDLAQIFGNSTVIFRRRRHSHQQPVTHKTVQHKFICISPSSNDKLMLLNVPKTFSQQMVEKVKSRWTLQSKKSLGESEQEENFYLKMKGYPWGFEIGRRISPEAAAHVRYLLLELFRFLRSHNFALRANVNFKGTADSMFFEHDPSLDSLPEDLFVMYLNKTDRIRLLDSPAYMVDETRAVIEAQWGRGLQAERVDADYSAHEFKLRGKPWWADGEMTIAARQLVAGLLAAFQAKGWDVGATLDISRRLDDKTVFVFRQGPPVSAPWMCLSFHETDKVRLTAEHDTDALRNIVRWHFANGLSGSIISRERPYGPSHEWKLGGTPFRGSLYGTHQLIVTTVLLRILADVERRGWRLAASADVSAKYVRNKNATHPLDVHSWFFVLDAAEAASGGSGDSALCAGGPEAPPAFGDCAGGEPSAPKAFGDCTGGEPSAPKAFGDSAGGEPSAPPAFGFA